MKRILFFSLILVLLAACSSEEFETSSVAADGELMFSVAIPEESSVSRAGETGISSLKVVVFDEKGILSAVQTAAEVNKAEGKYKIQLEPTSRKRILHFLANYNETDLDKYGMTEEEIFSQLYVDNGKTVYWQKMELNEVNDKTSIPMVYLLRNMAKIDVINKEGNNFGYESFSVVNVLDRGTVAPYYANPVGDQPDFNKEAMPAFADLKYSGVQPYGATYLPREYSQDTRYVYERNQQGTEPAFILVKGSYNGKSGYYKINIVYDKKVADGSSTITELCNLIRNYHYAVTINKVDSEGYATEEEAMKNPASNNLFVSIEIASLRNISDGDSRLFVSFTDTTVVRGVEKIFLKYKYLPVKSETNNTKNEVVRIAKEEGTLINNVSLTGVSNSDGYSIAEITLNSGVLGMQTITVYENDSKSNLSRKINVRVRPIEKLALSCSSVAGNAAGESVAVSFPLPNGLVSSMFPLKFIIESPEHTITPATDDYMPVVLLDQSYDMHYGKSYGYEKTVTWNEYEKNKTVIARFVTITPRCDTKIYAVNPYFEIATTGIVTSGWAEILNLNDTYYGSIEDVNFTFRTNKNQVVLKLDKLELNGSDPRLTNNNDGTYTYTSTGLGTQFLSLKTSTEYEDGKVTLDGKSKDIKRKPYIGNSKMELKYERVNESWGGYREEFKSCEISFDKYAMNQVWIKSNNSTLGTQLIEVTGTSITIEPSNKQNYIEIDLLAANKTMLIKRFLGNADLYVKGNSSLPIFMVLSVYASDGKTKIGECAVYNNERSAGNISIDITLCNSDSDVLYLGYNSQRAEVTLGDLKRITKDNPIQLTFK